MGRHTYDLTETDTVADSELFLINPPDKDGKNKKLNVENTQVIARRNDGRSFLSDRQPLHHYESRKSKQNFREGNMGDICCRPCACWSRCQ